MFNNLRLLEAVAGIREKESPEMSKITRRNFLDSSARISAGLAAASGIGASLPAAPAVRTSQGDPVDKIHVALIGSGGMGRSNLRDFLRLPDVECLAIADVDDRQVGQGVRQVEERRGSRPEAYRDFRQILDRKDIDAVIVGTPDHWHALPTIFACQAAWVFNGGGSGNKVHFFSAGLP